MNADIIEFTVYLVPSLGYTITLLRELAFTACVDQSFTCDMLF